MITVLMCVRSIYLDVYELLVINDMVLFIQQSFSIDKYKHS